MDNKAIVLDKVSKSFVEQLGHKTLKHLFISIGDKILKRKIKTERNTKQALADISLEVEKGDFFGIVGRNGSGKSTLLKIIAGVYVPTSGSVLRNGTLTPFIELGVGFNPELSGKDNVFLNAALLGFTRKQTQKMYTSIVHFAELEDFMDLKLKHYSSGMQVRLAFSVAVKSESDILLLDEVLAVGDINFQEKCFKYFEKLKKEKKTVIFVSHDLEAIKKFCNKAVLINNSKLVAQGNPRWIAEKYLKIMQESN